MMSRLRFAPNRGSHLPILMKAVSLTTGPILELGCGLYSTTPLHWACFVPKRKLVTYENNPSYFDFLKAYETPWHEVHCVDCWDTIDISGPWSVVLVDHEPCQGDPRHRRCIECERVTHAEYVVVHDTERANENRHHLSHMNSLFKYRFWWREPWPNTTIFSNLHDVTGFLG